MCITLTLTPISILSLQYRSFHSNIDLFTLLSTIYYPSSTIHLHCPVRVHCALQQEHQKEQQERLRVLTSLIKPHQYVKPGKVPKQAHAETWWAEWRLNPRAPPHDELMRHLRKGLPNAIRYEFWVHISGTSATTHVSTDDWVDCRECRLDVGYYWFIESSNIFTILKDSICKFSF